MHLKPSWQWSWRARVGGFRTAEQDGTGRYKLFNESKTWEVVSRRLVRQLTEKELFEKRGRQLRDEQWLNRQLTELAGSRYENEAAAVVAKLLLRPGTVASE